MANHGQTDEGSIASSQCCHLSLCNEPSKISRAALLAFLLLSITYFGGIFHGYLPETGVTNVVNVFQSPNQLSCTHGNFRRNYKQTNFFPAGGSWRDFKHRGNNTSSFFLPKSCKLKYYRIRPSFLSQCFSKANITSIVTMGDSNGQRYYFNLLNPLKSISKSCATIRREKLELNGLLPDKDYFTRDDPVLQNIVKVHYRYCGGCGGLETMCEWDSQSKGSQETKEIHHTTIEHLPITGLLDSTVTSMVPFEMYRNKSTSYMTQTHSTLTSPEFFFKLYLRDRYPDMVVIFLPFNHVKSLDKMEKFEADIKYFHALVKTYIPRSTKVFYIPSFREFEEPRKSAFWKNRTFNGLLASERIGELNRGLFRIIQGDLLDVSQNVFGFFDLVDMSATRGQWSTDGVHMKPRWYAAVATNFWEVFCNSALNNDF